MHNRSDMYDVVHLEWLNYRKCIFAPLELEGWCNWVAMAPNTHDSPFLIIQLCVLRRITWKLQVIYGYSAHRKTTLLSDTFLVRFKVTWGIRQESYGPRRSSVVILYKIACLYSKPQHTSLFREQLLTWMTESYTSKDRFVANDASFYKNKVSHLKFTLQCLFNWWCTLILKLRRGTTVLLYEFATKLKRELELWVGVTLFFICDCLSINRPFATKYENAVFFNIMLFPNSCWLWQDLRFYHSTDPFWVIYDVMVDTVEKVNFEFCLALWFRFICQYNLWAIWRHEFYTCRLLERNSFLRLLYGLPDAVIVLLYKPKLTRSCSYEWK